MFLFFVEIYIEIALQFRLCLMVCIVNVTDDDTVLQQSNAWAYISRMIQVVARNEDGGSHLLIVLGQHVFDD